MQPLSGYTLFHLPAKADPHPLLISCWRAGRDFLPGWISCILCSPFSLGCYNFLWHHAGIFAPVFNLKIINVPFAFRMSVSLSSVAKLFCAPIRNSQDGILLAQNAFAGGCPQLKSVSLSAYILASTKFHSRGGSLSCFGEVPEWVPRDIDLLIWERLLDFACIL